MSTKDLPDRLLMLIAVLTTPHRRFKQLEEMTQIAADRWKAFGAGRQRPTAEMIEAVGKAYPSLVLWLITGETKLAAGQLDPATFLARKKYKMADLLKKEPCDLTEEEMLVVEAEAERYQQISKIENQQFDGHSLWMIFEAREQKLTRGELLVKWDDENQQAIREFERQRAKGQQ